MQADIDLRNQFLGGMSHAACTVNIITTDGPAGRAGVTVSAMVSVSADSPKPTLLVCVHHLSPAAPKILANGVLCVNVLRDDQSYISDSFAGRFKNELRDKFDCTDWVDCASGAPRIADPLVAFDCRLLSGEKIGTHHIFLCEVEAVHVSRPGSPLIYANRAYGTSHRIDSAQSVRRGIEQLDTKLSVGCFQTFGPYVLPALIRAMAEVAPSVEMQLVEGDHRRLRESLAAGEIECALLYDMELGTGLETIALGELGPYVLLPDGHPLAGQIEVEPADLAGESMILLDLEPSRDYFVGLMQDAGVTPQIGFRTTSFEMVRGMVGHGMGYALLATKPASNMTYDGLRLVTRPLAGSQRPSKLVLAHRVGRPLSSGALQFADLCLRQFGI